LGIFASTLACAVYYLGSLTAVHKSWPLVLADTSFPALLLHIVSDF